MLYPILVARNEWVCDEDRLLHSSGTLDFGRHDGYGYAAGGGGEFFGRVTWIKWLVQTSQIFLILMSLSVSSITTAPRGFGKVSQWVRRSNSSEWRFCLREIFASSRNGLGLLV
jgi:hypothetical protein